MSGQQKQKQQYSDYLNLAHQFLDTNFIESVKTNKFNVLPIISTNPVLDSFVHTEPPIAVDYFSYDLTSKEYHNCWKNISNNQFMKPYELSNVDNITKLRTVQQTDDIMMFLPTTSQVRLENACWRAWYKKLKCLKELNPTDINWFKENDVTVLYGPLIEEEEMEFSKKDINKEMNENITTIDKDIDGDCKMNDEWTDESANSSDNESMLNYRRFSVDSVATSLSSQSNHASPNVINNDKPEIGKQEFTTSNETKILRSILKKRKNVYSISEPTYPKKRISFSEDLINVRFIA